MALFKHSYSGLITGGLGMPACCGLITMGFGLFRCRIEIHDNPATHGGGTPVTGFYVPMTKPITTNTKMVLVTVRLGQKTWRKSYVVDRFKASVIVRVVGLISTIKQKIIVGVDSIHRASQRVTAIFRK